MSKFVINMGLFNSNYFSRVLSDPKLSVLHPMPIDSEARLQKLLEIWNNERDKHISVDLPDGESLEKIYDGLPSNCRPRHTSESEIEQNLIRKVLEEVFGYHTINNKTMSLSGEAAEELKRQQKSINQRPDFLLFANRDDLNKAIEIADKTETPSGVEVCRRAQFILDAKRFDKGIGRDDPEENDLPKSERRKGEPSAIEDIVQVGRYLRGYKK